MSTIISTAPPATRAEALTRRAVFLIGVATLALVAVLAVTAFRGPARTGPLDWSGDAELFTHPTLPGDRDPTGTLRNDGMHPMRVDIGDVRVLGSDGEAVPSNAGVPADVRQDAVGGRPRPAAWCPTPSCSGPAGSRCCARARRCR